jgi:predicted PurR-regulated permease PerM
MDRERIVQLFFFGFLALMAYLLYQLLTPFLVPILWAMLLSFLFHPLAVETERFVRSRSLAAVLITLATAAIVIVPAIWFTVRLAQEAETLSAVISAKVSAGDLNQQFNDWMAHIPLHDRLGRLLQHMNLSVEKDLPAVAMRGAQLLSQYMANHVGDMARNVMAFIWDFLILLFTLFYFLRDGESYYEGLRSLAPMHEEDQRAVFETLSATLSSVMRGMMVTAALQAVVIGLGLVIFGVPYWAFLSILTAVFGIFPLGGTAWVWVPAAAYIAYASGWTPAIGLVIWCSVAVAAIDNFIKPWAMRHGTELPTLALFLGIAGGLTAYGPLGIFAGPAVISVFMALLKAFRRTYGAAQREAA